MGPGTFVYEGGVMFTDIHSHVIWGVDDGAEQKEETFRLLKEAAADGIGRIICTPHVTPGVYEFPEDTFQEHFWEATEYIAKEGLPLQLFRGAEILYTDNTPRLLREKRIATLAGTNYAMIEFSPTDTKERIFDALQKVSGTGVIPVLAHMERYPAIGKIELIRELKTRYRVLMQMNARTLTRNQPFWHRKYFDSLFTEELIDFIATDTHAMPGRETCMAAGMKNLREKYGEIIFRQIERKPEMFFK